MRLILATLIYWYSLSICAGTLVVQSPAIADLYGTSFVLETNSRDVIILTRPVRPKDAAHAINSYALATKFTDVLLLGRSLPINNSKRFSVISQFILNKAISGNIYVLQGEGALESERLETIKKQVDVKEVFPVETEHDLRKAMLVLNRRDKGFLIINAFNLRDNWNDRLPFTVIENLVVDLNKTHVEVGICHDGFKTALAIGPTSGDTALVLKGENSTSICASLERLKKLGNTELYDQLSGTFYRVTSNKR